MKRNTGWSVVVGAVVCMGWLALAACEAGNPGDVAVTTVERAQVLVCEDMLGNLYDVEYVADLTPDEFAAVVAVGLTDEFGNELPALTPIVDEYLLPAEVPVVDEIEIVGVRPHVEAAADDAPGTIRRAVTVNGLNGSWYNITGSISTSGAWHSTCYAVSNIIAATAILASPSTADFDLYFYGNSSCSGSAVGSATSGSTGALDLARWTSTSGWSSNPRKTLGFKVKSYSGRGSFTLKVAYWGYR